MKFGGQETAVVEIRASRLVMLVKVNAVLCWEGGADCTFTQGTGCSGFEWQVLSFPSSSVEWGTEPGCSPEADQIVFPQPPCLDTF